MIDKVFLKIKLNLAKKCGETKMWLEKLFFKTYLVI